MAQAAVDTVSAICQVLVRQHGPPEAENNYLGTLFLKGKFEWRKAEKIGSHVAVEVWPGRCRLGTSQINRNDGRMPEHVSAFAEQLRSSILCTERSCRKSLANGFMEAAKIVHIGERIMLAVNCALHARTTKFDVHTGLA